MAELLRMQNLNAADLRLAESVFEFVQFLLDDDANLTPAGNLTGAARQRLRARLEELIAAEKAGGAEAARDASPKGARAAPAEAAVHVAVKDFGEAL
jgi:hypothetical protein